LNELFGIVQPDLRAALGLHQGAQAVEVGPGPTLGPVDAELDLAIAEALELLPQAAQTDLAAATNALEIDLQR
jgi:hypothetical protein